MLRKSKDFIKNAGVIIIVFGFIPLCMFLFIQFVKMCIKF